MKQISNRFNKTIEGLVKAFFNETLAKGNCSACAVGNIVAYANNAKIFKDKYNELECEINNSSWGVLFNTNNNIQTYFFDLSAEKYEEIRENLLITEYSIIDLMKIEYAFETNSKIMYYDYDNKSKEEIMNDQYNGLMAVVEVLCQIEGLNEIEMKVYKEMFSLK